MAHITHFLVLSARIQSHAHPVHVKCNLAVCLGRRESRFGKQLAHLFPAYIKNIEEEPE